MDLFGGEITEVDSQAMESYEGSSLLKMPSDSFTLDLLRKKMEYNPNGNTIISPMGVMIVYSMLMEGADGETKDQLNQVLRLGTAFNDTDSVKKEFKKILNLYTQRSENFTLSMGNKAILNDKYQLQPEYETLLKEYYQATASMENFSDANFVTRLNAWVANHTNNLIRELFKAPPKEDSVLILINAIYFKGKWAIPFKASETKDAPFINLNGTTSNVKMMYLDGKKFPYAHFPDQKLKIIELPYVGGVSMIIMMPTEVNGIKNFVSTLTESKLSEYLESMEQRSLATLAIPKFKLRERTNLHEIMPSMGLHLPFSDSANLSHIANAEIKVSKSVQEAIIIVDEKGTQAAAGTYSVTVLRMSFPSPPEVFIADRPFVCILRDMDNGINLFVAVVNALPNMVNDDDADTMISTTPASEDLPGTTEPAPV